MNLSPELNQRIDAYLREVERHLGHKSAAVRRELAQELREHIQEALRRRSGTSPTPADLEAVLADMDPPESFAEPETSAGERVAEAKAAATGLAEPPPRRNGTANRWFLLGVAFLMVNAYGVWKVAHRPEGEGARPPERAAEEGRLEVTNWEAEAPLKITGRRPLLWKFSLPVATTNLLPAIDPPQPGEFAWTGPDTLAFTPALPWPSCQRWRIVLPEQLAQTNGARLAGRRDFVAESESLSLLKAAQVHCTPDREVTLQLTFNAAPVAEMLTKHLQLTGENDKPVSFSVVGLRGTNTVLVRTGSIDEKKLKLELTKGMPAQSGPLGSEDTYKAELEVATSFDFLKFEANSPAFEACQVRAVFSSKPEPNGLAGYVSVEPAVKFTAEPLDSYWESGVTVAGDFKPGGVYTIRIKKGLPAASGGALAQEIERVVQFPDRPQSLAFSSDGRYLSPRGKLLIPLEAMNLRGYVASVAPVFANNLVFFAHRDTGLAYHYGPKAERLAGRAVALTNALSGPPNVASKATLNLRDFVTNEPSGAYWVEIRAAARRTADDDEYYSGSSQSDSRLVVITDLGLAARKAKDGITVWVNSLRQARPVAGAEVVLYAVNNQEIGRVTSDTNGLAFLPCADDAEPFLITARAGGDLSYLDLQRTQVDQGEGLAGGSYLQADELEADVFTERGVYRPGETAHMQAIVRDRRLAAPKAFPALFRVRRPDGRVFKDLPVTLDAYGAAEASLAMPDYLPTGRYTFELVLPGTFTRLGGATVALEDFVPPQIRVQLEPPKQRGKSGENIAFNVAAQHLFGRPAAGLSAKGSVSFKAAPFAPAAWKGWKFGDEEKSFSTVYRQSVSQLLDEEGKSAFEFESNENWRPPAALQAVQQVTVTELNGRSVTAYGSSFLDPYPFYIGLRAPAEGTVRVGATQRVEVVEVKPDGAAVTEAVPLVVRLERIQWNSALRRNSNGRYEWKSERTVTLVREQTLAAGGAPKDWFFAVDRSGEYLATATDPASGASTSLRFHAAAPDQEWVEWSREKPDRVELKLDREHYRPGDAARLLVKAPFDGLALLTVESDRVLDRRVVTLAKNTGEIEVPVRPDYAPNVYCTITLIRPAVAESVWSAHRATGAALLRVEPPARRLNVTIATAATNRPQAKMSARIMVKDEAGKPAQGDVTVMAVDEAICMLTGFETPDPLKTFLAQRGLGVSLYDLYRDLMPVIDDAIAGVSHTGGDDETALRRRLSPIKANRFRPLALWQPGVHLNAQGEAEVLFDLPEFAGELRLMAVAYNATQTGSAESHTLVKRGLVVQPSLPRFLAPGDVCDATIELFNESGANLPVQVRLTCGGPLSAEKAEERISLKAGGSAHIRLPVKAGDVAGAGLCTFEVTGGTESYRETIELPVRPAAGLQTETTFGVLKAGERREIAAPAGWVDASVVREVRLSGEPSLKLGRALDYVMRYPYGCLEQTVSGSFPLLYAADLANRILPGSSARQDMASYVQSGLFRVLSMQLSDGSFSLWPNGTYDEHATLYAIHFLLEARKAAYPVADDRVNAALRWLRERMDASLDRSGGPGTDGWIQDMQARAYGAQLLALAGTPDHGWNARLREQASRLNYAGRVHTAAALLLAGEPQQAGAVLQQLGLPKDGEGSVDGLLNSPTCDAALLLSVWLDIDPAQPAVAQLVHEIDRRQQAGHWANTKEDALVLLALGKYAQRVPPDRRPFTGLLSLPGGLSRATSRTQEVHWVGRPGEKGAVTVVNDGPGTMYFSSLAQGVPAKPEADVDAGVKIRRIYMVDGQEVRNPKEIRQGDLVTVELHVDTQGRALDNLAIEELLPAGWEIENPNLATSEQSGVKKEDVAWVRHRDLRDDRLILFSGPVSGEHVFWYAARAVSPGRYTLPPAKVECMYAPHVRSVHGAGAVEIKP